MADGIGVSTAAATAPAGNASGGAQGGATQTIGGVDTATPQTQAGQQTTAQPATKTGPQVTPAQRQQWFDAAAGPMPAFDASKYKGEDGQYDMESYHNDWNNYQAAERYRRELSDILGHPLQVGDATLAPFQAEPQVKGFLDFARQVMANGLSAKQLMTLHRLDEALALNSETAAKRVESSVAAGQPQQQTQVQQRQQQTSNVVVPKGQQPASSNSVPSTRALFAEMFPGDVSKLEENPRILFG